MGGKKAGRRRAGGRKTRLKPVRRQGAISQRHQKILESYVSPVNILGLRDVPGTKIPMHPLHSAEYFLRVNSLYEMNFGRCRIKGVGTVQERRQRYDLLTEIFHRHREYLLVTFPTNNTLFESGDARGTSVTGLGFLCLCLNLVFQVEVGPKDLQRRSVHDCDFVDAARHRMAIHGRAMPISEYRQKDIYATWEVMSKRFREVDLDHLSDMAEYRDQVLIRTAQIILHTEEEVDVLDMSAESGRGYVLVAGSRATEHGQKTATLRQVSARFIQEVLCYYVATEMMLYARFEQVEDRLCGAEQKTQDMARMLRTCLVSSLGESTVPPVSDMVDLFKLWVDGVRHHITETICASITNTAVVDALVHRLRDRFVAGGHGMLFRFENQLAPEADNDHLASKLYSPERRIFLAQLLPKNDLKYFVDTEYFAGEWSALPEYAVAFVWQQHLLTCVSDFSWADELLFEDYDTMGILFPTPQSSENEKRGYYYTNSIERADASLVFEPETSAWQLPVTMRGETPAVVKLCRNYFVYHRDRFYAVADMCEAIAVWALIVVTQNGSAYQRHDGFEVSMDFLMEFVLKRMVDVPREHLPHSLVVALDRYTYASPAGAVEDLDVDLDDQDIADISNLFACQDMRTRKM